MRSSILKAKSAELRVCGLKCKVCGDFISLNTGTKENSRLYYNVVLQRFELSSNSRRVVLDDINSDHHDILKMIEIMHSDKSWNIIRRYKHVRIMFGDLGLNISPRACGNGFLEIKYNELI